MPGWTDDIRKVRRYQDLPAATQNYLKRVEELVGVPIQIVSVAPDREETMVMQNPFRLSPDSGTGEDGCPT